MKSPEDSEYNEVKWNKKLKGVKILDDVTVTESLIDKVVCYVVSECEKYSNIDLETLNNISNTAWKMTKELSQERKDLIEKLEKGKTKKLKGTIKVELNEYN